MTPAQLQTLAANMACLPITRYKDTIFIPLPSELWQRTNGCECDICKADGTGGYWDTMALSKDKPKNQLSDFSYRVHHPGLHPETVRKAMAYKVPAPVSGQCVPAGELAAEMAALSPADRAALPRPITDTTANGIEWTCRPGGPWNAETVVTLHAADRSDADIDDAKAELEKHLDDIHSFEIVRI